MNELKSLSFSVQKFDIIKENDKSFLGVKLWAIAEGLCRNNVDFTPESIEGCIPTVYNKPVLAAFDKTQNELLGHNDLGLVIDPDSGETYTDYDNGFLDKVVEKAVGLIPLDSKVQIEEYKKNNWLTFNALIWAKYNYKLVKLLKKLGTEKISVEVTLTDYEENTETGTITVKSFIFDGVTIIGVPEGIKGANIKIGEFAQSEQFGKFQKAFQFAYENDDGKDDNGIMKFDFKGMGIRDFNRKIDEVLNQYRYKVTGCDWDCRKYWVEDVFPDENVIILQDCESQKLIKIPFTINEDREIVLDFSSPEEVVIADYEITYKKKVEFSVHSIEVNKPVEPTVKDKNKKEGEAITMDVRFRDKFVEKSYIPVCKLDKFVLFTKQDEIGKVYKIDFDLIDKCEEDKFDELLTKFSSLETKEEPKEEMVSKKEFDELALEKTKLEGEIGAEKEKCTKIEEELATTKTDLEATKTELSKVKEEFAKLSTEKFRLDAEKDVEEVKENFGEEFDIFKKNVFELIDSKQIVDREQLNTYTAKQFLELTKKLKTKKNQFSLNKKDDTAKISICDKI